MTADEQENTNNNINLKQHLDNLIDINTNTSVQNNLNST